MSYSRQPCPVWLFTDLTGNILDDNYYMSFLENTIPYLPQPVYQDDQGLIPWANPLQFHPDGTLPDNLYFKDGSTYRLEIRRGPTQSDPLIRLIQNFLAANSDDPSNISLPIDNQITNPQFALLSFSGTHVINNTGTNSYDIAPGWVLDLVSSGATVVTLERIAIAGDENLPFDTPTNPSYSLSIAVTSGTLTSMKLRQRFNHAPAIWASEGLSVNFTGKMLTNSAAILVQYVPSNGTATTVIADTLSSVYQFIAGGVQLPASDSIDTGDDGYVDLVFTLPINGTMFLTNIQALGSPQAATYPYAQTTVERQIDQTFHYYKNSLLQQSKQNILAGWNFGLNPWQFSNPAAQVIAPKTSYITDQTILYQETASAIQVGRAAYNLNYGLELAAVNGVNANRCAIIQYIDTATIAPYWGQVLSCMVRALYVHTDGALPIPKLKMRLIWRTNSVPTVGNTEPIVNFDANGDPVFAAGWTAVAPLNDIAFEMINISEVTSSNLFPAYPFDKFQLPTPTGGSIPIYLGVVVYINGAMNNTLGDVDYMVFDRISLTPNDFAIDSCIETFDESLRRCQFYYETSYPLGYVQNVAVTVNGQQSLTVPLSPTLLAGAYQFNDMYRRSFQVNFKTIKRSLPSMAFWSPNSATSGFIQAQILNGDGMVGVTTNAAITSWTETGKSQSSVTMIPNDATVIHTGYAYGAAEQGVFNYHYAANCLLGL